jgi:hypothetical protein
MAHEEARERLVAGLIRRYGLHRLDVTTVNQIRGAILAAFHHPAAIVGAVERESGRAKRLTPAQLSATIDALNFVIAGDWDESSHEHSIDVYERALDRLSELTGRLTVNTAIEEYRQWALDAHRLMCVAQSECTELRHANSTRKDLLVLELEAEIERLRALIPIPETPAEGDKAVKLAFTFAFARGFQVADETSRSCISAMDDAWEEYQSALSTIPDTKAGELSFAIERDDDSIACVWPDGRWIDINGTGLVTHGKVPRDHSAWQFRVGAALRPTEPAKPGGEDWATISADRVLYLDEGREQVLCDRLPSPVTLLIKNLVLLDGVFLPLAAPAGFPPSPTDRGDTSVAQPLHGDIVGEVVEALEAGLLHVQADIERSEHEAREHGDDPADDTFIPIYRERESQILAILSKLKGGSND